MIEPNQRVLCPMITPSTRRRSKRDRSNGAEHATMVGMDSLSRRSVLLGGLGFLAACSSTATESSTADILLGGEEPQTEPSGDDVTDSAAEDVAAEPPGPTPTPDPERSPVKPASFEYLEGNPGTLEDFAGAPLVINFFASWCPPCRKELPDFEEISQKYAGQVEFLGFSVTDDAETTRELLAETGVTFPVGMDPDQSIHFDLGGIAMPTTLFVDRFGNLATGRFGAISKDDLEQLILEEIL